jgi:hypothetical protein
VKLSQEQKRIINSLGQVPTVSHNAGLYPELVSAGLVAKVAIPAGALYRYVPTDSGLAVANGRESLSEGNEP